MESICEITETLPPLPPDAPDTLLADAVHDKLVPLTLLGFEIVKFVAAPEHNEGCELIAAVGIVCRVTAPLFPFTACELALHILQDIL